MKRMNIAKIYAVALLFNIFVPFCWAQSKPVHPSAATDPDRLGQTCAQMLKMSSAEWVEYFETKTGDIAANSNAGLRRAIGVYGKCYDERTDRLAAALSKSGRGPLMGANGNFRDFQKALDDFTTKALAATNNQSGLWVPLYEKLFRYQFYQGYLDKNPKGRPLTPDESDEFAKAKNRFGEVLGLLPDDSMHAVHSAFRQIFDTGRVTDLTKLELYRYAIFLLAPAKDKPFAPPPF